MAHRFTCIERVQFSDTDMAGIVHFSNFFRFMERGEHAVLRSIGLSVREDPALIAPGDVVVWPRVHASCDFHAPLCFEEEVQIEVLVEEVRNRAIRYLIRLWRPDGELAGEGRMAAACAQKDPDTGKMKAVEIPPRIRSKIEAAPPELLRRLARS
jgi:acyl-CoA thioester hydrolase